MQRYMERFGFYAEPPMDYPDEQMSASGVRKEGRLVPMTSDRVDVGRVAIGQGDLFATPLQMASVAQTIGNGGVRLKPHIMAKSVDPDGRTVEEVEPEEAAQVISRQTARELTVMMKQVVREGTGTAAALEGVEVAGKTGTAELNTSGLNQPWFMCFTPEVGRRGHARALPGRYGRHHGRADRQDRPAGAGAVMQGIARDTMVDGRYRIVGRIGSGGMADVYEAEDTQLGRRVALKLLHRQFAEDPEFVERFRREASAAAGLSHPNIVQVFDRGEWDGTYYIAMELLEGRNLKQVVREHGALEPALAVDIVVQILKAARFAHRRGIVHRDIKPHNVIVDTDGRAKVTDFGIARAGVSDMTETGSIMGTAQYLSPEQAQGHPVDARSDLYSIGVVLYELLTGAPPFDADSPVTIALKQVSEDPVSPRVRNPAVPPALDSVVMRALRKDPADRYQDADEFIAALETAMAGGYVPPEEPPVADDEARNWRRIAVIAIVVLALLALAVGAWAVLTPAQKEVPNVVGKRSDTAAQTLQSAGFEVDIVPIESDTVAEGRVAGQRPEPGSEADEGSVVTITVSSGPGDAPVPLVQGLTADAAEDALREAGFKSEQRREFSDTVKNGRVIETSPPEGTTARKGTTVTSWYRAARKRSRCRTSSAARAPRPSGRSRTPGCRPR